jgi:inosine-uridine nucleoside N-ribohydrolase
MATVIFDTDPGVDDAMALLYLCRRPEIEIAGITTVAGNATVEITTRNALYLAERFGIEAPVARGAATSLRGHERIAPPEVHGHNGLGDITIGEPRRELDPRPAHRFIIDLVRERPGEITIVAVARLTNLARALIEDPGIAPLVREVIVMGGAFGIDGHVGNASPVAEANILGDPHAADAVCTASWPVTMVGLDVTERVLMTPAYLADLRDRGGDDGRFLWDVARSYQLFHAERRGLEGNFTHDPCAAICAVDRTAFAFREDPVRVAVDGVAEGMTLQRSTALKRDRETHAWTGVRAQRVAIGVDADAVLAHYASTFLREPARA